MNSGSRSSFLGKYGVVVDPKGRIPLGRFRPVVGVEVFLSAKGVGRVRLTLRRPSSTQTFWTSVIDAQKRVILPQPLRDETGIVGGNRIQMIGRGEGCEITILPSKLINAGATHKG